MATSSLATTQQPESRRSELKAFDDSKSGVKGWVDLGLTKIPRIFVHDKPYPSEKQEPHGFSVPVISLQGLHGDPNTRRDIVNGIREACEKWGFFQLVDHGIPVTMLDEMIDGVRRFHEQDSEVKKELYHRDNTQKVVFNTNFDLYESEAANWRDSVSFVMAPNPPGPQELPIVCRDILVDYTDSILQLGQTVFELISESLNLDVQYLKNIDCTNALYILAHYYPACPEPDLTLGTTSHTDSSFLTILLQGHIGGLQVLHQDCWVDVVPVKGALTVNVGDILQLITNDKFMSVHHRVLANKIGPRISIGCFFRTHLAPENSSRLYGPLKELLSEENPPKYREATVEDVLSHKWQKGLDGAALDRFRL